MCRTSAVVVAGLLAVSSSCGGAREGPEDGRVLWALGARGSGLHLRGVATTSDGRGVVLGEAYSVVWHVGEPEETETPFVHYTHGFAYYHDAEGATASPGLPHYGYICEGSTSPVTSGHIVALAHDGTHAVAASSFCPVAIVDRPDPCEGLEEASTIFLVRYGDEVGVDRRFAVTVHTGEGQPSALAAGPDGAAAVAGGFSSTATFAPCRAGEVAHEADADGQTYLAVFDGAGELSWLWTDPAMGGLRLAFADDGDLLVAGSMSGTLVVGAGQEAETTLSSAGEGDLLLARFGAEGTLRWARRAGGAGADGASAVAAGPEGAVAVAGTFTCEATVDGGDDEDGALASAGGTDALVALYDASGTLSWARAVGGPSDDRGGGVAVTAEGRVAAAGGFREEATVASPGNDLASTGGEDAFVALLDPAGEPLWAWSAGGEADDRAAALAAYADGTLLVAGPLGGRARVGPARLEDAEIFVARLR